VFFENYVPTLSQCIYIYCMHFSLQVAPKNPFLTYNIIPFTQTNKRKVAKSTQLSEVHDPHLHSAFDIDTLFRAKF
jgi:hypothetical protein